MSKISINDIAKEIQKELTLYEAEVVKGTKKVAIKVVKELVVNTQKDANKRTSKYKKHIAYKKTLETANKINLIWYVKDPEYRLSHLLEKGHALKNGGRTKAYKFISKNEEIAKQKYEEGVRNVIQNK